MTPDQRKKYIAWIWCLSGMSSRTDITWETMAEMTDAEVQTMADAIQANPMLRHLLDIAAAEPSGSA